MSDGGTATIFKNGVATRYYSYQLDWTHRLAAREPWQSYERIEYFIDGDNGDDGNAGTSASPLATLAEWVRRMPTIIGDNNTHSYVGTFRKCTNPYRIVPLGHRQLNASIIVRCEEVAGSYSQTHPGMLVLAGTTPGSVVVNPGVALLPNAYLGHSLEMVGGQLSGVRRTIFANTATTITPCFPVVEKSGARNIQAGDSVRIVRPNVEFDFRDLFNASDIVQSAVLLSSDGAAGPASPGFGAIDPANKIGLVFIGCKFVYNVNTLGRGNIVVNDASLYMWGCDGHQEFSNIAMSFVCNRDYMLGTDDAINGYLSTILQHEGYGYGDPYDFTGWGCSEIDGGATNLAKSMFSVDGQGSATVVVNGSVIITQGLYASNAKLARIVSGRFNPHGVDGQQYALYFESVVSAAVLPVLALGAGATISLRCDAIGGADGLAFANVQNGFVGPALLQGIGRPALSLSESTVIMDGSATGGSSSPIHSVIVNLKSLLMFTTPPSFGRGSGNEFAVGNNEAPQSFFNATGRALMALDGSMILVGTQLPPFAHGSAWKTASGSDVPVETYIDSIAFTLRSANGSIQMPLAADRKHPFKVFLMGENDVHTLSVLRAGGDSINGAAGNWILTAHDQWVWALSDGVSNWYIG